VAGGLGTLGEALAAGARDAGAEIVCGLEATGIQRANDRIAAVTLADGSQIETGAVLSTFDLKRTILSLFAWSEIPRPVVDRAAHYRMAGGTGRLLVALDVVPVPLGDTEAAGRSVIHTAFMPEEHAAAHASWRALVLPERPPASIRIVSAVDPRLAPHGKAAVTVTLSGIPGRLFDGSWTAERREALRQKALALMDSVLPGSGEHVLASELLVPPDIEESLGVSDGDLAGGEIAADQMFANRAWAEWPRTPIDGLYLGGPSTPVAPSATAAAGWIAAKALIADHRAGRLK
jgi:phytoene dehydrogenase-like protein